MLAINKVAATASNFSRFTSTFRVNMLGCEAAVFMATAAWQL